MTVEDIKQIIKKNKRNLLWLFIFLAISSLIVILSLLFVQAISTKDKLIYCLLFITTNLILIFINYLIFKNPFVLTKVFIFPKENQKVTLGYYFYFLNLIFALVFFFVTIWAVQLITNVDYNLVLKKQWYLGFSIMTWILVVNSGFTLLTLFAINKKYWQK
ncbi:hypothetical protein [Spiroplasma chrysopicola]|uniref:Transmembrane protein n=1 Tax=Spiroplasma chrysopicola DF-1 TaxID=1276227 RepID=R4U9X6_9MOLU|nr:hypothetical protein [Spiroplasma chrysopicola]AGM24649.1 hypothetical protein SCHRY_v1c00620 [Spiroplasma chrysopicola DF-1]